MEKFADRLIEFVRTNNLFSTDDKLLIAVSGGLDSVCLTHLLHQVKFNISIAHCNFQLRGEESEGDELFVQSLAGQLEVPFFSKRFDARQFALSNKCSIQMAARSLRYTWFHELRNQYSFKYILTAHHQNDNLETVILNLVRGTGPAGFQGILPNSNYIVRPFLFCTREEILDYARQKSLKWREDSSNATEKYQRNFIRQRVIPLLKEINPSLPETIKQTTSLITQSEQFVHDQISDIQKEICRNKNGFMYIDIASLLSRKNSFFILSRILVKFDFNLSVIKQIFETSKRTSGKVFYSPSNELIRDRDFWIVKRKEEKQLTHFFIEAEETSVTIHNIRLELEKADIEASTELSFKPDEIILDFKKLSFPLLLRSWKMGDRISPLGLKGSKLVSDILTDKKVNLFEKQNTLIVESGGAVAAMISPECIASSFAVTGETESILIVKITRLSEKSYSDE